MSNAGNEKTSGSIHQETPPRPLTMHDIALLSLSSSFAPLTTNLQAPSRESLLAVLQEATMLTADDLLDDDFHTKKKSVNNKKGKSKQAKQ